jgi:formamidopyrimidine-DNA glycosylase
VPELPEVDTYVRDLRPHLIGRRIIAATLSHANILSGVSKARLLRELTGARIADVTRRAKHALVHLDRGTRLVVQPGMTGSLYHAAGRLPADQARHVVLHARLDRGGALIYHDVRRIGTLRLLDERGWARFDAALGPEPLGEAWTAEAFMESLRGSRVAIKKFLMDQRKLVGIGNIYANEALFAAGVDPSKPANRLTPKQAGELRVHVRQILARAIAASGTTFRDYRTGSGEPGNFQFELSVYGREGQPCRVCGTTLTGTHSLDARATVFCHRCQK